MYCKWHAWNCPQRPQKETGRAGNRRTNQDPLNHNIVEINQNTDKSPGDLKKIAVTLTPVKEHQITLEWKTYKE